MVFLKIGKYYLCSEGEESAFSLQLSVLGKWHRFCNHTKSPNTAKIAASAGTGQNPKGGFTSCDTQSCALEIVFSAKHSFADIKERKSEENINLPK